MNSEDDLVLVIESAIVSGSISIFRRTDGVEIASLIGDQNQSKAEGLLEDIFNLLKKHKIIKKSIKSVVFVTGLGSLTGLKIGEATAKGLAKSFDCQYKEISLWDIFAEISEGDLRIFYIPAGKDRIARRVLNNGKYEAKPEVISAEYFREDLSSIQSACIDARLYIYEGLIDFFDVNLL